MDQSSDVRPVFTAPTGTRASAGAQPSGPGGPGRQLYIQTGCDRQHHTVVSRQYAAYPFRLSRVFRLETANPQRAYLYMMNASPGLLAGDDLQIDLQVGPRSQLYLTDQAATKVHSSPQPQQFAHVAYQIRVGPEAHLELVPEPLILFADAYLQQSLEVHLHPTSQVYVSDIIVPGRLARSEYYEFGEYRNRVRLRSLDGTLLVGDAMHLQGRGNPLRQSLFFARFPIMANIMAVLPTVDVPALLHQLEADSSVDSTRCWVGMSPLPNCSGLLIRAMADQVGTLQHYQQSVLNRIRQVTGQPLLPEIPK